MISITLFFLIFAIASGTGALIEDSLKTEIFYGENAERGEFPYMVSIQRRYITYFRYECAGSIINSRFILTSAMCIYPRAPEDYTVMVSDYNIFKWDEDEQHYNVSRFIIHPSFEFAVLGDDIAFLELTEDIQFNEKANYIPLPLKNEEFAGNATVCGWGRSEWRRKNENLQKAELLILTDDECRNVTCPDKEYDHTDDDICAGTEGNRITVCFDDAGGPLVKNNKLVGIVSRMRCSGVACSSPYVFTEVSHYIDWINSTLSANGTQY